MALPGRIEARVLELEVLSNFFLFKYFLNVKLLPVSVIMLAIYMRVSAVAMMQYVGSEDLASSPLCCLYPLYVLGIKLRSSVFTASV